MSTGTITEVFFSSAMRHLLPKPCHPDNRRHPEKDAILSRDGILMSGIILSPLPTSCHSERSEESLLLCARDEERFFASLRMTIPKHLSPRTQVSKSCPRPLEDK